MGGGIKCKKKQKANIFLEAVSLFKVYYIIYQLYDELSCFDCPHWQNTADEPGGDQDLVDKVGKDMVDKVGQDKVDSRASKQAQDRPAADSISLTTRQLLQQAQDEVSEPTKSAQVEGAAVEAGVEEGGQPGVGNLEGGQPVVGNLEGGQPGVGNRLTKSASWFNSLSRRASRKTPLKKRSFPGYRSVDSKQERGEREEVERDTSRVRLNK